jgi:two-component system, NarL family, nitrate/nitrite response regulator NarL
MAGQEDGATIQAARSRHVARMAGRTEYVQPAGLAPRRRVTDRWLGGSNGIVSGMKILICDDHALFRAGLALVLRDLEPATVLLDSANAADTFRLADEHPDLDLVVLDLNMPGMDGLTALVELRARWPALPVVIVSSSEQHADVRAAIDRGASGFIPKSSSAPVLLAALRLILSGGVYVPPLVLAASEPAVPAPADRRPERAAGLTARQLEVLDLMAAGRTNREICDALGIAEGTVKAHVATILELLGVANRTEAAAVARQLGLDARRASQPDAPSPPAAAVFRREGDYWTIEYGGAACYVRDSKGLGYLAALLRHPGKDVSVLELAGVADRDPAEVERTRQNVARAVRTALDRLGESVPALAGHLERSVRTGERCTYTPDPRAPTRWSL